MIVKIVLGESLNCLIGELKLSYKKVSTIIVESLAEVRSAVRRGGLGGVFFHKSAMKAPFFALFYRFPRVIFGVKAEDIINGEGIFQVFRSDFEANELLYESVFQTYLGAFVCAQSNVNS